MLFLLQPRDVDLSLVMSIRLKNDQIYLSALLISNFMVGSTTVSSYQPSFGSGGGLLECYKSPIILFIAPSTAPQPSGTSQCTQLKSFVRRRKMTMQRANKRRRDDNERDPIPLFNKPDKIESRDGDVVIYNVLSQAENPFLRRGKELLDKKKKNQEISTGKNYTLGQETRSSMSPPSTTAKGGKEKAAFPVNESTPLDTHTDQIQDWHSPRDGYDAMREELLSLKELVDR